MSNKKLLVDLSKSIIPTAYSTNPNKYATNFNPNYFHTNFNSSFVNNAKILTQFSSPRSSRSSCSTYSSNSCSTNCTSTTNGSLSSCDSKSTSSSTSSRLSLNLSSSTNSSHTCDVSDCSGCKSFTSSSVLSTSNSSDSSSYFSTDEQPETIFDDEHKFKNNNNNNSYICNSSSSSNNNSISTIKTSSSIGKITRSASKLNKQDNDCHIIDATQAEQQQTQLFNKVGCMWSKCKFIGNSTDIDGSLVEHIKSKHIFSQKNLKTFRCMWKGCPVFKKPSCSFNWLERHVIDHIETKPFLCIFNGCKRKFRTESARERHVQSHINSSDVNSQPVTPVKTRNHLLKSAKLAVIQNIKNKNEQKADEIQLDDSVSNKNDTNLLDYSEILKALTKKRKALTSEALGKKFKKAQYKDFVDECTTSVVDHKLKMFNYQSGEVVLQANIIGVKPKTSTSKCELILVEWIPKQILENEWVEKSKFSKTKTVSIHDLNLSGKQFRVTNNLNQLFRRHRYRSNRRK